MSVFFIPLLATITLHVFVVALFFVDWKTPTPRIKLAPPSIQAKLVEFKPQSQAKPIKKLPKKIDLTKKKAALKVKEAAAARKLKLAQEKKRALALKKKKEQDERSKIEEEKRKNTKAKKVAEQQKSEQQQAQRQQQLQTEFDEALKQEEQALLEATYAEQAQSYIALISNKIAQNWSRPPTARNGMSCELSIKMVPSGTVINARISKSSGNALFDRAALQAVKKVERFPEIADMPIGLFEREFRNFTLKFTPEDLRL